MSSNYTAGQFNDSFQPKRLRNWQLGTNYFPGNFPGCPKQCPQGFIAGDNGHLLPHIPRNACTSPWGDYRTSVWEQKVPCACIDMLRNPREYTKPRNIVLVSTEMPCPQAESQAVCKAFKTSDTNDTQANNGGNCF